MALRDLFLGAGRVVPSRCLSAKFARSGGPGGQNVNKVASKVDLRLDLAAAEEFLGEARIARIRDKLASRLDADGHLQVVSEEHRTQARNLDEALDRMQRLLIEALQVPRRRRPTRPTRASQRRRLDAKRRRGEIKKGRRAPPE